MSYRPASNRAGIFKRLWSPGIDSASLYILAGRYDCHNPTRFLAPYRLFKKFQHWLHRMAESISELLKSLKIPSMAGRYDYAIPPRFLTPIDCLKIPAQLSDLQSHDTRKKVRLHSNGNTHYTIHMRVVIQHFISQQFKFITKPGMVQGSSKITQNS